MSKCISGCLSERTKILLADGSEREISSLRPGDIVKLSNGSSSVVMNMWKGFEETLIKITTGSGRSIQMTEIHPVLANNDWIKAKDLKIDDILSTIGDDTPYFCKIIKISSLAKITSSCCSSNTIGCNHHRNSAINWDFHPFNA